MQILRRLQKYMVPDSVWDEYCLDQKINDRGIMIVRRLVEQAIRIDEFSKASLTAEMVKRTDLANPNSVLQLKSYLTQNGIDTDTIGKKEVAAMMKEAPVDIAQVLSLRLQLAKSSVKKYTVVGKMNLPRCQILLDIYKHSACTKITQQRARHK